MHILKTKRKVTYMKEKCLYRSMVEDKSGNLGRLWMGGKITI